MWISRKPGSNSRYHWPAESCLSLQKGAWSVCRTGAASFDVSQGLHCWSGMCGRVDCRQLANSMWSKAATMQSRCHLREQSKVYICCVGCELQLQTGAYSGGDKRVDGLKACFLALAAGTVSIEHIQNPPRVTHVGWFGPSRFAYTGPATTGAGSQAAGGAFIAAAREGCHSTPGCRARVWDKAASGTGEGTRSSQARVLDLVDNGFSISMGSLPHDLEVLRVQQV